MTCKRQKTPKLPRPLEKHVEAAGDTLMLSLGWTVIRFSQARETRQTPGIPDRKYYRPGIGQSFWWEAKRPGGRQSDHQQAFQAMCEACGETYVLGDLEALQEHLVGAGLIVRVRPGLYGRGL